MSPTLNELKAQHPEWCFNKDAQSFLDGMMSRAAAEATYRTKQELGRMLDRMAETAKGRPYRIPMWEPVPVSYGSSINTATRPRAVELTQEQIQAIRFALCGPKSQEPQ